MKPSRIRTNIAVSQPNNVGFLSFLAYMNHYEIAVLMLWSGIATFDVNGDVM